MSEPKHDAMSLHCSHSDHNLMHQHHNYLSKKLPKLRAFWYSLHLQRRPPCSKPTIAGGKASCDKMGGRGLTSCCQDARGYFAEGEHVDCNCRQFWRELDVIISHSHRMGRTHVQQRREIEEINSYSRKSLWLYLTSKRYDHHKSRSNGENSDGVPPMAPMPSPTDTVHTVSTISDASTTLASTYGRKHSLSTLSLSSINTSSSSLYSVSTDFNQTNRNYMF